MKKTLYGLKQITKCWFVKLATALKKYGFLESYSSCSLFTLNKGTIEVNILVYVDDMIIVGNYTVALEAFRACLGSVSDERFGSFEIFSWSQYIPAHKEFLCVKENMYVLDINSEVGLLGLSLLSYLWKKTISLLSSIFNYLQM